jgi:hypothetical protein
MLSVQRAVFRNLKTSSSTLNAAAASHLGNNVNALHLSNSRRNFWHAPMPKELESGAGVYVTKYKIVKPLKDNVDWDDFLIAMPERDQLATTSKDIPMFIR